MPRVQSKPAFFVLCAASSVLACGDGASSPTLGVDFDEALTPDEQDDESGSAPVQPIDGPEEVLPLCQSQFFGTDPLSPETSARSCSLALAVAVLNPANVQVAIAGQLRPSGDEENGWLLLGDGMTVLLLGTACDEVMAGADVALSALCE